MEAYSPSTNTHYPSWEALVEAEANGWVAVVLVSNDKQSWPWVEGPYSTKREAKNACARKRTEFKRSGRDHAVTASFFVRPAWRG